jgi:methyl-accepting chemotaxis protein
MKLGDISVSTKLWVSTLVILLAMFGTSAWMQRSSNQALLQAMGKVQNLENIITLGTRWKGMTETNVQRVLATALNKDPLLQKTFGPALKKGIADISELQKDLVSRLETEDDKAAMAKIGEARVKVLDATRMIDDLKAVDDVEGMQTFIDKDLNAALAAYAATLDQFIQLQETKRDEAKLAADAARVRALWLGLAAMVAVVAASLGWMVMLARSIREPLARAVQVSEAIAAGDLTQRLNDAPRGDEIGQLMRAMAQMNEKLRRLVGEVRHGVESVNTASAEIATGNQDLSARTEQTASSLQETASSMEQLTGTVSQSADVARQANQLASSAAEAATRGGEVVSQVVGNMQEISASSRKIADIIAVIDGIAFQTNILALNAAVEAARAGEQGRGFAVVASEVRSLAQRSAEAAREIKSLIGSSVDKVEAGAQLVAQSGAAMEEIVSSVRRMTDMMGEIASAATEQRDGIGQVNQAVTQLDQMTQQNAALVEQSAAAAGSLREQARRLAEVVSAFNVGHGDGPQLQA